ncbi:MAG: tetratricopeptide repeat protein [Myxococcota bacterium]
MTSDTPMRSLSQLLALLLLGVGLFALVPAGPVAAQGDAEYRQTLRRAIREFDRGAWAEARALFLQAHDLQPTARTLRSIGMASFEMGDYVSAYAALRDALVSEERPLTDVQRSEVEQLFEATRAYVGRFLIVVSPAGGVLEVDAEPARFDHDGYILLPPGDHTITVDLEGYRRTRERVRVEGGEERELPIDMEPTTPEVAAPADPVPTIDTLTIALWASGGGFVALTLVGAIWAAERNGELSTCDDAAFPDLCVNRNTLARERDSAVGISITAAILAGAAIAGGFVWWQFGPPDDPVALRCGLPGTSAVCAYHF